MVALTLLINRSCERRKASALKPPAPASKTTAAPASSQRAAGKRSRTHGHPVEVVAKVVSLGGVTRPSYGGSRPSQATRGQ